MLQVERGPTGRRVNQKCEWLHFVEKRRRELHDEYPCSMPTHRRRCPKHRIPVPQETYVKKCDRELDAWVRTRVQLTGICKPCRDELHEQLTDEYLHAKGERHALEAISRADRGATSAKTVDAQAGRARPAPAGAPSWPQGTSTSRPAEPGRRDHDHQRGEHNMTDTETIETAGELELYEPRAPATLFHTDDPDLALERMAAIAKTLVDVVDQRKLFATINGRRFVTSEGWTTLGGMCGVHAIVTETRPNETGDGIVARAEARTLAGQVVGAAESECSRAERRWKTAEPYAIRSMAQTRAISRALRAPLGQIVVLAGYEPAGAEEMSADTVEPEPDHGKIPAERRPSRDQIARIGELLAALQKRDPAVDWPAEARKLAGCPGDQLTGTIADILIGELEEELAP